MVEILGTVATILAVTGVLYNNARRRAGFIVWMFSNSLTAGLHFYTGFYSMMVRDLVFLALAAAGYVMWGKEKTKGS
jgi:nicotinamide riboside transporter PnuC